MRVAYPSTVNALKDAYRASGTLDKVIDFYGIRGVSKGTLSRIMRGMDGVSAESEAEVRRALELVPSNGAPCLRPRLPLDPALRIAKLQALLRQAEAELQEVA